MRFLYLSSVLSLLNIEIIKLLADNQTYFLGRRIGVRVHSIIVNLVYEKSLARIAKLSHDTINEEHTNADTGKIVNLIAIGIIF